jgi:hypothetical protein
MSEPAKVTEIIALCNICGLKQHGGDCLSAVKDELYAYKLELAEKVDLIIRLHDLVKRKDKELFDAQTEIERLNKSLKEWELWKESNT